MRLIVALWVALACALSAAAGQPALETRHLKLRSGADRETVTPGGSVRLTLEVELKSRMHVYAPEVEGGYIPVSWKIEDSPLWRTGEVSWPPARKLYLEAIEETVPVYEGAFRLERRLEFLPAAAGEVTVEGSFRYQACDDRMCYRPETVPLRWRFRLQPTARPES